MAIVLLLAGARPPIAGLAAGLAFMLPSLLPSVRAHAGPHRPIAEALNDHNLYEQRAWKREVGGSMPCSLADARRWLREHLTGAGRSSMLLWVGDVDAARMEIEALSATTREERFGLAILRGGLAFVEGREPDLAGIRESLAAIPDRRARRHGRICLAILEARLAHDRGEDPWAPIARGWAELDGVEWRATVLGALAAGVVYAVAIGAMGLLVGLAVEDVLA